MNQSVSPMLDPAHDVLHYGRQALDAIFAPRTVAVIGATETAGSVGRTIVWNLISTPFGGTVFPVNPKHPSILGIKAYPNIASAPEAVDLAVVVTPAPTVPGIIHECVEAGVKGAVIISAGFKETGQAGAELERQVMENAQRGKMRIIGPNCLGVMNPTTGLNATFANNMARRGSVGFISQSGALCTAILDWSLRENVGFSAFVSIGSMLDVDWGDLIYHLGDDPHTESIVMYMETIGDARAFLSAAREVALAKPIIVIKPGRTEGAARAAASHTGSLTGSDQVLESAFRRSGALRVNSIAELFYMAEVLAKQPRPQGRRLTILTNAGGPGVLATDALITNGGELAPLSAEALAAFDQLLPAAWSHNNPVDILGDASPERYGKALEIAAKDPNSDGILIILTPQAMTDPTATAEALAPHTKSLGKPVIATWMGGNDVAPGEAILNKANIPSFPYPDTAARVFDYMANYSENLRSLYETPLPVGNDGQDQVDRGRAARIIQAVRASGRTILTEFESKQLLAAYGIPVVETRIATSKEQAVGAADAMGYPVVLKLHSETITHKSDVGGVQLDLKDARAVEKAFSAIAESVRTRAGARDFLGVTVQPMIKLEGYELILGSSIDPQFGPVLLFGLGGQLVEVFKDRALGLPPLTTTLARRMMEQTRIFTALKGVRGRKAVDLAALETLLVRFSQLIAEQRWIKELDVNPLLASDENLLALDARVLVYPAEVTQDQLPKLAIRPYPAQYVSSWTARDGREITIRPILPEDESMMIKFHETLSDRSVNMRYLRPMLLSQRVAHERLARICHCDYDREIALVAESRDKNGERFILAASRMSRLHGLDSARFSILISDQFQGLGLGNEMVGRIVEVAQAEGIRQLTALITADNQPMQHIAKRLGFRLIPASDQKMIEITMDVPAAGLQGSAGA
ncbi:MAG TPA: bifunctional acetate--CoA ligase family protein/GNAT family N-acetyltransferase [Anaerolineales bacterium]|nr:bifunctional acetate--CoA ligase family protein/GNAT family N-acetyltransferase [Anaerolineales bacterium]